MLGELDQATRPEGMKFGFYFSLYGWYNPIWKTDRGRYVREDMTPQFKDYAITSGWPGKRLVSRNIKAPAKPTVIMLGVPGALKTSSNKVGQRRGGDGARVG
jgi:alpha-L-fucosidase